jgi:hypothetical protein
MSAVKTAILARHFIAHINLFMVAHVVSHSRLRIKMRLVAFCREAAGASARTAECRRAKLSGVFS